MLESQEPWFSRSFKQVLVHVWVLKASAPDEQLQMNNPVSRCLRHGVGTHATLLKLHLPHQMGVLAATCNSRSR